MSGLPTLEQIPMVMKISCFVYSVRDLFTVKERSLFNLDLCLYIRAVS